MFESGGWSRRRATGRAKVGRSLQGLAAMLSLVGVLSCGENPLAVSETEIWQLELEQVHDGQPGTNPRRGTITMRLRLNHTKQPDPTCAGRVQSDITTVLADVEVAPSRISSPASGTMDGSWNCHGFAATVRLNDGRTYELRSDVGVGVFTEMSSNWWTGTSGSRGGFLLQPVQDIDYDVRQSHFDLVVQNQSDVPWDVALIGPLDLDLRGLRYLYNPTDHRDSSAFMQFVHVPARNSVRMSWPSHENRREGRDVTAALEYRKMFARDDQRGGDALTLCVLGPDHPDEILLVFEQDPPFGVPDCGRGWVGHVVLTVDRSPLFLQPGAEDAVTVLTQFNDALSVTGSHPSVTGTLGTWSGEEDDFFREYPLTVRVAADAPRTEHQLTLRGLYWGEVEQTAVLPVSVYEMELEPASDTLVIAAGTRDTTSILVDSEGVFTGLRFTATNLPAGVLLVPPAFAPGTSNVTRGAATVATFSVYAAAAPGVHDITICAIIVADPRELCHPTTVTLVIPDVAGDFTVTAQPAALQVAPGQSAITTILVNRTGPGVGLVEISLGTLPTGVTAGMDFFGDTAELTLFAASDAPSGAYQLEVTGTNGPLTRTATIDVIVGGGVAACEGFSLRLDFSAVTIVPGSGDLLPVFVDREPGFTDQVELVLAQGTVPVSTVLSFWDFDPPIVVGETTLSLLSFAAQPNLPPGAEYQLTVLGASPLFEDPTAMCQVPLTFEVLQ